MRIGNTVIFERVDVAQEPEEVIPAEIGAVRKAVDSLGNGYQLAQGKLTEKLIMSVIRAQQISTERKEKHRIKTEQRAAKRLGKLLEEAGYSTELGNELIKLWTERPQAALEPENLTAE